MHRIITDYTNVEASSNIKVYVRARPPEDNSASMDFLDWRNDQEHKRLIIKDPDINNKKYSEVAFQFDRVFWIDTQQQEIFNIVCRPQIDNVLRGCNACCFAYGQTGSGKTYSMFGEESDFRGIIPRSVEYIFSALSTQETNIDYRLSCSFLEIYNDAIRDLGKVYLVACGLIDGNAGNTTEKTSDLFNSISKKRTDSYYAPAFKRQLSTLNNSNHPSSPGIDELLNRPGIRTVQEEYQSMHYEIREDGEGNVFVKDLSNIPISSVNEIMMVIELGLKIRATHETKMNNTSSRSHTVFSITIIQTDKSTGTTISGRLNLVDLAGSERLKKSESQGARLKEALHINTSLTALGKVIMALEHSADKIHVPYRDSKLTRILQNSLGGNSYTVLLAAIHPSSAFYDECLSTLQFANRCRNVTNNPRVNYIGTGAELEDKDKKIKRLTDEILLLRSKLAQYERSGGSGLTGLILAEKLQSVLARLGMAATIAADGSLKLSDGKIIPLEDLNAMAVLDTARDEDRDVSYLNRESKLSTEKLQLMITELEQERNELKQKYKSKKNSLEKVSKELQELTGEYARSKQSWQHREYELQQYVKEKLGTTKGMEQILNIKHQEAYQDLVNKNQEILNQHITMLSSLPQQMTSVTQLTKKNELTKEEVLKPLKEAYEKTIKELDTSRQLELDNQKQQYEYWLKKKEEMLINMTNGFNNYRAKKSNQLRKCELEILKLFQYVESLENILRKAENGEYYVQTLIVNQDNDKKLNNTTNGNNTMNNTMNNNSNNNSNNNGVIGNTLLIPKGTIPIRPAIEKKGELDLSRKILKKHNEHIKKDEKAQTEAVEALLGHCGMKGDDYTFPIDISDQELEKHIRGLITSPSMGRDIIVTASSQLHAPQSARSSSEKRHSLFNPVPTLPPPSYQRPQVKQTNTRPTTTTTTTTTTPSASASGSKNNQAVQGTAARAVQTLNKLSLESRDKNINENSNNILTPEEDFLIDDSEGIMGYQFPSHKESTLLSGRINHSIYETDNGMICSPNNQFLSSSSQEQQPTKYYILENELNYLKNENLRLQNELNGVKNIEKKEILETIEGNETIEYIRQLENEAQMLRNTIRDTASQLQQSKVANGALQRQYETLKSKVKRPISAQYSSK